MKDEPGALIAGKYELISIAGEGGMAVVWRAETRGAAGFSRPVAVKRVLVDLTMNPDFVAMFVEEARVSSLLQHPNIVQVHDFGIDDGDVYYLVMEWVEGLDLARWIKAYADAKKETPWHLVAAMGIEMLRGLSSAHTRVDPVLGPSPVIHRDVTPHNVMVGVDGIVKLSDFGLARASDRGRITGRHVMKGKISYVSPELTYGRPATVRSDLFSVGVVLWECLAGRKLFLANDPMTLISQIRDANVKHLESVRPGLPRELYDVVFRALAQSPADRWSSALEMARALSQILRTVPQPSDAAVVAENVRDVRKMLRGESVEAKDAKVDLEEIGAVPKE